MDDLWRAMSRAHVGTGPVPPGDWRIEGAYSTFTQIGVRRTGALNKDRIQAAWRDERPLRLPGDTFSWLPGPDAESICVVRGDLRAHRRHPCPMREIQTHGRDAGAHDMLSKHGASIQAVNGTWLHSPARRLRVAALRT